MTFAEYQKQSASTAMYAGNPAGAFAYLALGLTGEAGEVADKIKKILRDRGGEIGSAEREQLLLECGDVLWYLTQMGKELGASLEEIADMNVAKLKERRERGILLGSGDGSASDPRRN